MNGPAIKPAAPAPAPMVRDRPRHARDDRFQRALDEQESESESDEAGPRRATRAPGRDRRLGDRRDSETAVAPPDGAALRPDDPLRQLQDWLIPMMGCDTRADAASAVTTTIAATAGAVEAAQDAALTPAGVEAEPEPRPEAATVADPAPEVDDAATAAALEEQLGPDALAPRSHADELDRVEAAPATPPEVAAPAEASMTVSVSVSVPASASSSDSSSASAEPPQPDPAASARPELDPVPASTATLATNRARLVLDHDGERVVVSVAVRHGAVSVALDAASSTLGAAVGATLDRLDAALQGHGLHLADLTSGQRHGREPSRHGTAPAPRRRIDALADAGDTPLATDTHDPRLRARA